MKCLYGILVHLMCFNLVYSYETYRDLIPNGYDVFHPCKKNTKWDGVGHKAYTGGGARNPFGLDFKAEGKKWTQALCQKDSDGDGKSNGEELGDPNCVWKANQMPKQMPERTANITHPGVCAPVDSVKCNAQKKWVSCSGKKFTCPAFNETGMKQKDFRFPLTKVPPQETTYLCVIVKLPEDQDYHIIGTEPVLDNTLVIHHMILNGCTQKMQVTGKPYSCLMGNPLCGDMLAAWTVGGEGQCSPAEAAIKFGKTSYKYAQLQVHWTNPRKRTDWSDNSGIKIYYTATLRPNDLGVIMVGQMFLDIPGGQPEVTMTGTCGSNCSRRMLSGPVNVTSTALHAHFLGKKIFVEQFRNGKKVRDLGRSDAFDYNNPESTYHRPSVPLLPGDELKTTCVFDSRKRSEVTYYGEGTFDEMCFAFISYYPKIDNRKQKLCLAFERYSMCQLNSNSFNTSSAGHNFGKCNVSEFESHDYYPDIYRTCGSNPTVVTKCEPACRMYVNRLYDHICMKSMHTEILRNLRKKNKDAHGAIMKAKEVCDKTPQVKDPSSQTKLASSTVLIVLAFLFYINSHF